MAGAPTPIEDFIRLETQVWQALADGDADADGRMLSDDFLGVYPQASRIERPTSSNWSTARRLHRSRCTTHECSPCPSPPCCCRTEPSSSGRTSTAGSQVQCMYVSSLWCLRDGEWLNVFSQDTPADRR